MKSSVITFPGSNCDRDMDVALTKFGFKNGGNYKCGFQQIQKYLININNQEKEYFKKSKF